MHTLTPKLNYEYTYCVRTHTCPRPHLPSTPRRPLPPRRVERIAFCDNSAVPLSHGGDQSTSGSAPNRAYFTAHAVGTSAVLLFGGISGPDQEALAQEEFVGIVEVSGTGFRYMSMPLPGRQAPPPRSHHCSAMLDAADGEGERVVLVGGAGAGRGGAERRVG